jgi:hypothetical protein
MNTPVTEDPVPTSTADASMTLANALQCTVCLETMLANIHQCTNGHALCGTCLAALPTDDDTRCKTCPTCRVEMDATNVPRNRLLEGLRDVLPIRCPRDGCTANVPHAQWDTHAADCEYRPSITWTIGPKVYIGQWKGDLPHGHAVAYQFLDPTTKYYEGQWVNGSRHGQGTLYHRNGTKKYVGQWESWTPASPMLPHHGRPHHHCIEYGENGHKVYDGQWAYGAYHGEGTMYNIDGTVDVRGRWVYGIQQEPSYRERLEQWNERHCHAMTHAGTLEPRESDAYVQQFYRDHPPQGLCDSDKSRKRPRV